MSEPEPPTPEVWPVTRCQEAMWEAACQLLLIREELENLKAVLPLPLDLEERLEHQKPYDMATAMFVAIECISEDCLKSAQLTLEETAAATDERLKDDYEAEERKWGRL
jgi:hypothetical protein